MLNAILRSMQQIWKEEKANVQCMPSNALSPAMS